MRSIVTALVLTGLVSAQTTHLVPAGHATIQAAMDAAADGDLVLVAPGTYAETLDFGGKAITVESSQGAAVTTIDGGGLGSTVQFSSNEPATAVLRGFTVTGGNAAFGGGIRGHAGAAPTIRDCIVEGNTALAGGGIFLRLCDALVENCVIRNNTANGGGGFGCLDATLTLRGCVITGNVAMTGAGVAVDGYHLSGAAATPKMLNCTVAGNTATGDAGVFGGGLRVGPQASVLVRNGVVWGNVPDAIDGAVSADHAIIQGGHPGVAILDEDPLLADLANGDVHLSAGSPAVNAGFAFAGLGSSDVDGDPRVVAWTVDLGADEVMGVDALWLGPAAAGTLGEDVVLVNGSAGLPSRRTPAFIGQPFALTVDVPAALPFHDRFALFVTMGLPPQHAAWALPVGGGVTCLPLPWLVPSAPVAVLADNVFGDPSALLPSTSAPWLFQLPGGPCAGMQITVQGLMVDAAVTSVHVTNAVFIDIL